MKRKILAVLLGSLILLSRSLATDARVLVNNKGAFEGVGVFLDTSSGGNLSFVCSNDGICTLSQDVCAEGEVYKVSGGAWVCSADNDSLGALACSSGQIPQWNGTSWVCAADDDIPEAGDFGNATDLDANGALLADTVGLNELAACAGPSEIVEYGSGGVPSCIPTPSGGGGSGTSITVNGNALSGSTANFNDTTPAAPTNGKNVVWQKDASDNISAYLDLSVIAGSGLIASGGILQTQSSEPSFLVTNTSLISCSTNADNGKLQAYRRSSANRYYLQSCILGSRAMFLSYLTKDINLENPSTTVSGKIMFRAYDQWTVNSVHCSTDAGSVVFNFEYRSDPNTSSTSKMFTVDKTCNTTATAFAADLSSIPISDYVTLTISSTSGSPGWLRIHLGLVP